MYALKKLLYEDGYLRTILRRLSFRVISHCKSTLIYNGKCHERMTMGNDTKGEGLQLSSNTISRQYHNIFIYMQKLILSKTTD